LKKRLFRGAGVVGTTNRRPRGRLALVGVEPFGPSPFLRCVDASLLVCLACSLTEPDRYTTFFEWAKCVANMSVLPSAAKMIGVTDLRSDVPERLSEVVVVDVVLMADSAELI